MTGASEGFLRGIGVQGQHRPAKDPFTGPVSLLATLVLGRRVGLGAALIVTLASNAGAGSFWKPFIAGAATGFGLHESSHLLLDAAFDAGPRLKGVNFGPVPFFAVTHKSGLPSRKEALISGAGFLSQHATSEILLTRRSLGEPLSAFEEGAIAFHLATSAAYAGTAFARYGPHERDTRGVAEATHTDERAIGLLVLAPAAFDAWRCFRPDSRVARWGSRLSKAVFLGVIAIKK